MIVLPAAYFRYEPKELVIMVPEMFRDHVESFLSRTTGGQIKVSLAKPGKPRTVGERSQNHAINGYCQQIAVATGQDFDTVKGAMKRMAIGGGYPFRTEELTGEVIPYSESEIDTTAAKVLIQTIRRFAAEYEIQLRDYDEETA